MPEKGLPLGKEVPDGQALSLTMLASHTQLLKLSGRFRLLKWCVRVPVEAMLVLVQLCEEALDRLSVPPRQITTKLCLKTQSVFLMQFLWVRNLVAV